MKNIHILAVSLLLFVAVLIGVTIIEPVTEEYTFLQPFIPAIMISGFFTFIISAGLFLYVIFTNLKGR